MKFMIAKIALHVNTQLRKSVKFKVSQCKAPDLSPDPAPSLLFSALACLARYSPFPPSLNRTQASPSLPASSASLRAHGGNARRTGSDTHGCDCPCACANRCWRRPQPQASDSGVSTRTTFCAGVVCLPLLRPFHSHTLAGGTVASTSTQTNCGARTTRLTRSG